MLPPTRLGEVAAAVMNHLHQDRFGAPGVPGAGGRRRAEYSSGSFNFKGVRLILSLVGRPIGPAAECHLQERGGATRAAEGKHYGGLDLFTPSATVKGVGICSPLFAGTIGAVVEPLGALEAWAGDNDDHHRSILGQAIPFIIGGMGRSYSLPEITNKWSRILNPLLIAQPSTTDSNGKDMMSMLLVTALEKVLGHNLNTSDKQCSFQHDGVENSPAAFAVYPLMGRIKKPRRRTRSILAETSAWKALDNILAEMGFVTKASSVSRFCSIFMAFTLLSQGCTEVNLRARQLQVAWSCARKSFPPMCTEEQRAEHVRELMNLFLVSFRDGF